MNKICAIIVTYNRAELLCRCVKRLLEQTYPLDILIYDNHSSVDTKGTLEQAGLLKENVTYFYAEENTGGSGGFHNGMKKASEKDYDALWLMDDDGYAVKDDTLAQIVDAWEKLGKPDCILNSLVVCDEQTLKLSFSLDREFDGNKMIERAEDGLLCDLVSPFNGTFVPTSLAKKIGFPVKEFFVYGDETEYMLRAKASGAPLYTVVDSFYFHPSLLKQEKKFLGRKFAVSEVPLWKTYCSARNSAFFRKKYFGTFAVLKSALRVYIGCILADKNKWAKFRTATRGIIDGLKGDFSRPLDLSK